MSTFRDTVEQGIASGQLATPCFVYDEAVIRQQASNILSAIKKHELNADLYYAMKANANMAIVKILHDEGLGVDIASGGELHAALTVGVRGEEIIFTGPSKSDAELRAAVEAGVATIHVESVNEAKRLQAICEALDTTQDILIRVNATYEIHGVDITLSGDSTQFGIMEEVLSEAIPQIAALDRLTIHGLHVYNASGVLNYASLLQNVENVFDLVLKLEKEFPAIDFSILDVGGGFGIDYKGDDLFDVDAFFAGTANLVEQYGFQQRNIKLEIGRYLVADSGKYLVTVVDEKESRGVNFLITDGGAHHFLRPALFKMNHPATVWQREERSGTDSYRVSGVLCTNVDLIAKDVVLPAATIGDIVAIEKTGAYGWSVGIHQFLSHPTAPEYLLRDGQLHCIRDRGTVEDMTRNQHWNV